MVSAARQENRFNSKVVQLKEAEQNAAGAVLPEFQFQSSSIKRKYSGFTLAEKFKFQFQSSSIKSSRQHQHTFCFEVVSIPK